MPTALPPALKPRKLPVQARSAATVDAILQATLQVLLQVGKERLTTTRVAARAGVSVGTLYQYFPNKTALLQATLKRHIDATAAVLEQVCAEQHGQPLQAMASALVSTYVVAKMKDGKSSAALYAVSADLDGQAITRSAAARMLHSIAGMLGSSSDRLNKDPSLVAAVVQGTITGVVRSLLESGKPPANYDPWRNELVTSICAYLEECRL